MFWTKLVQLVVVYAKVQRFYLSVGTFYGLFLAPKIKEGVTVNEYDVKEEPKTFEGLNDS